MKKLHYSILFTLLISFLWFASAVNANGLADPEEIINGKPMSFTTDTNDNWYFFNLGYDTNIAILGSDSRASYVDNVYVYDENMTKVFSKNGLYSESVNLYSGNYFINISDSYSGTFSVFSLYIANPEDSNPIIGSITNPYLPENGVALPFGTETATNIFYFEMTTTGNVLISGSDSRASYVDNVYVYDENMTKVFSKNGLYSESVNLYSGNYFINISDSYSGSITIYSPAIGATPILPVYPTFQDGIDTGKQACFDDPTSCGIPTYAEGLQDCFDDPEYCGIKPKTVIIPF